MKEKWSSGKIAAVILGSIGAGIVLIISLYASVYKLSKVIIAWDEFEAAINEREDGDLEEWLDDNEEEKDEKEKKSDKDSDLDNENTEYYEFHNEIREDLSYQVSLEDYKVEAKNGLNAKGTAEYPVITGENVKNPDVINKAIQKELSVIEEHVNDVAEKLSENASYLFEAECYVTYMDEDIFSMAYMEYGYLDGDRQETYVVSVNIDMDNGMVMTNTQLLDIDDEFSIDFRRRSDKQNGENELLDRYSDQNITEMMNQESTLIIFYTPLGMEVGFNHYYGWVTVTYPDYQDFQKKL